MFTSKTTSVVASVKSGKITLSKKGNVVVICKGKTFKAWSCADNEVMACVRKVGVGASEIFLIKDHFTFFKLGRDGKFHQIMVKGCKDVLVQQRKLALANAKKLAEAMANPPVALEQVRRTRRSRKQVAEVA